MEEIHSLLELPENVKVFSMFALGYPVKQDLQQNRFEPERIHFIENKKLLRIIEGEKFMQDILVVVDMQNDFIDGALGTKEAVTIVPKVEEKIRNFKGTFFYTGYP